MVAAGRFLMDRYGEWQDTEWDSNMGRMVPIDRDTGGHQETVSSRQVQVQVPAPFELDGRVYEEKQFNMEQLLLEKEGEMFSFCGLNRGAIRPGAAHVRPCPRASLRRAFFRRPLLVRLRTLFATHDSMLL